MVPLLFLLLAAEVSVAVSLLVRMPLRRVVIAGIDWLKKGHGLIAARTTGVTLFVVLVASARSLVMVRRRSAGAGGAMTEVDRVILSRHLLEALLLGYCLFLWLIIDRLHHYTRELRASRKGMKVLKKQYKVLEEEQFGVSEEARLRDREIACLKVKVVELESEAEARTKEAHTAEKCVLALRKQSESLLFEYDRLLEDNQNLRSQLHIDRSLSHSESKKNSFSSILSPLLDELRNEIKMEWHH